MNCMVLRRLVAIVLTVMPVLAFADAPVGRYTVTNGGTVQGTVYDNKTKLTWQQVPRDPGDWVRARDYCKNEAGALLGGAGWRLPTINELLSIVDYSRVEPAIDPTAFPNTPNDPNYDYWSISPYVGSSESKWRLKFRYGSAVIGSAMSLGYIRCVR